MADMLAHLTSLLGPIRIQQDLLTLIDINTHVCLNKKAR